MKQSCLDVLLARESKRFAPACPHVLLKRTLSIMFAALIPVANACTAETVDHPVEPDSQSANLSSEALDVPVVTPTKALPEARFFLAVPDMRLCAAPLCGGYFVSAVNLPLTRCADGTLAERCYVASIDWSALGGAPQTSSLSLIVEGKVLPKDYSGFGNLGVLAASDAWASATGREALGLFLRLRDNGLRCITEPCFSIDAEVLNLSIRGRLSSLDFSLVGATDQQLDEAYSALATGSLLASGRVRVVVGRAGLGRELRASQLFLPTRPHCLSDDDCQSGELCHLDPSLPCQPGSSGVCEPAAPACAADSDCPNDNWCRSTQSGGRECVPFAQEGELCGGFIAPWLVQRCEPTLVCDYPRFIADVPGTCRATCASDADCDPAAYCASDGLCHADGSCDISLDCTLPGNVYARIACVGYAVCKAESLCDFTCGDPRCIDLSGVDFGPCKAVLGWGVVGGICTSIGGCDAKGQTLFDSQAACQTACPGA